MLRFEVCQTGKQNLTSSSDLALIGQCCQAAQVAAVIAPRQPVLQGMRTSDVMKSMVGLLSLGKSDFEATEPFRENRFFKEALNLSKIPGSVWMRQCLDARGAELRELTDELNLRLLERTEGPITAHQGYVCCDVDTFVMDNSKTKKEEVCRTYQGVDGYTTIAAYLGYESWNISLELRAGSQYPAFQTDYFLERVFPRIERLVAQRCPTESKVFMRKDSGFDGAHLLFMQTADRDRWAARGGSFDFITKRNPRKQNKEARVAQAEAAGGFVEARPDKRVGLLNLDIERAWQKKKRSFRLVVQVIERTIYKKGQSLLVPDIELQGCWTSLDVPATEVITLYKYHGTHEQFHSEIKTDQDLECLPSGKFGTSDAIVHLASFADNYYCPRFLGQHGPTWDIVPVRNPAKRRRLKTVLQEIMYRAAKFVARARRLVLDFGRGVTVDANVFIALQERLLRVASP